MASSDHWHVASIQMNMERYQHDLFLNSRARTSLVAVIFVLLVKHQLSLDGPWSRGMKLRAQLRSAIVVAPLALPYLGGLRPAPKVMHCQVYGGNAPLSCQT